MTRQAPGEVVQQSDRKVQLLKWYTMLGLVIVLGGMGVVGTFAWLVKSVTGDGVSAPAASRDVASPARPSAPARAVTTTACPGETLPLNPGPFWEEINPGNKCRVIHRIETGVLAGKDAQGEFVVNGWQERNPTSVRSARKVSGYYSLCPHSTRGNIEFDCTPKQTNIARR